VQLGVLPNQILVALKVRRPREYLHAPVRTLGDVVGYTGKYGTRAAWHAAKLA
jgi:hypothetical protein